MIPTPSNPRLPSLPRAAFAALFALFSSAPAFAETYTWSNNANTSDSNWSTAANWINNTPPVSGNTADILFAASPRSSPNHNLGNAFTLRSIWFYENAYTLTGNHLNFDGASAAIYNYTSTSISNLINLNSTIAYEGSGNLTLSNSMDGPGGFIKNGTGTFNINYFTTFAGPTHVNAGQISFGHTQSLLFTTVNLNTDNGLALNGFSAVIGNIAGTGSLNVGAANINIGNNNTSQTYGGQLSATTGSIEKRGAGTWTLTGSGSNLFRFSVTQGRAVLSGGSLTLTSTAGLSRALTVGNVATAHLTVEAGAVLNTVAGGSGNTLIRGASGVASTVTVGGLGSRWDAARIDIGDTTTNPGALIVDNAAVISGGDIFVRNIGGLLVQNASQLSANNLNVSNGSTDAAPTVSLRSNGQAFAAETILATPTSTIEIDRGILTTAKLTSAAGNGSIALRDPVGGSALVISGTGANATYTGSISGSGGITKNGPSTQTLSGPNSYSGPTTVNAGALILTNGSSASYNANGTGHITLNFGNLGHSSLRVAGGGTIEYPPTVIGGFLRGSDGSHQIRFVNSFNGTTFAVDSALTQDDPLALNNVTNSGNFTNNDTLTWNGGVNTSAGRFTVNSTAMVSSFENNGLLTIARRSILGNSDTHLVSGGGSRIIIEEQGELELTKSELHLNGSLLVNNGLIRGTTNVNFGALAKGGGEYGEVNVTDGGRFSPGNSPGSVTTGSTTWNSGGSYVVELADALADSGHDFWQVEGQLILNASSEKPFIVSLASLDGLHFDATRNYSWTILHSSGGIMGFDDPQIAFDTSAFKDPIGAGGFSLETTASDIVIRFSAVPEPTTSGLIALAAALMSARLKRSKQ